MPLSTEQITALLGLTEEKPAIVQEQPSVPVYPCSVCGYCAHPEKCIASVTCPTCRSSAGQLCRNENNGYTTYHEERWQTVKKLYGTYYK